MKPTQDQLQAITYPGNTAVIASAGTGKTRVLTERVSHLIKNKNISPHQILAFTFTVKASLEMKARIRKSLEDEHHFGSRVRISTIDSFCQWVLTSFSHDPDLQDFEIMEDQAHATWQEMQIHEMIESELKKDSSSISWFYQHYGYRHLHQTITSLLYDESLFHASALEKIKKPEAKAFLESISSFHDHLRKVRKTNHTLTFSDLSYHCLKLLRENVAVREKLQNQFKHILLDEAQDTSPDQFGLIKLLFHPERNHLFMVGDPKQSIYRFRKSDVALFFQLEDLIKKHGGQTITLSETFRTPQNVQSFFNELFPQVFHSDGGKSLFTQTKSHFEDESAHVYALNWYDDQAESDDKNYIQQIATGISHLVKQGIACEEIAVLSQSRSPFTSLEETLQSFNIPFNTEGQTDLLSHKPVRFIYHFWQLLYQAPKKHHIQGVLESFTIPWEEASQKEIYSYLASLSEENLEGFQFQNISATKPDHDRLQKLDSLRARAFEDMKHYPASFWFQNFMEDILGSFFKADTEILWAFDKIQKLFQGWQNSLDWNENTKRQLFTSWENTKTETSPLKSSGGVALLTMHKAKGLEFEHVFILPTFPNTKGYPLYIHHSDLGLELKNVKMNSNGLKPDLEESDLYQAIKSELDEEKYEEIKRLFYVALTRTKKNLYLFGLEPKRKKLAQDIKDQKASSQDIKKLYEWLSFASNQNGTESYQSFLDTAFATDHSDTQAEKSTHEETLEKCTDPFLEKPIFSVTEIETFADCPRKYQLKSLLDIQPVSPHEKTQSQKLGATERGVFIHKLLELFDPQKNTVDAVIQNALSELTLQSHEEELTSLGKTTFQNLESQKDIYDLFYNEKQSWVEHEIFIEFSSFFMNGKIDRLIQTHNDEFVIIDYKTHKHFKESDLQDFEFQLKCYALAIQKSFSVSQSIRSAIYLTEKRELLEFHFSPEELAAFEDHLVSLVGQLKKNIQDIHFPFTEKKSLCESCLYYPENYCGVKSDLHFK
jgi:ATP-dependent exoDNAse (exonuclease V) beta subunit